MTQEKNEGRQQFSGCLVVTGRANTRWFVKSQTSFTQFGGGGDFWEGEQSANSGTGHDHGSASCPTTTTSSRVRAYLKLLGAFTVSYRAGFWTELTLWKHNRSRDDGPDPKTSR